MDETTVQYWPEQVPETLWNYGLMQSQQPSLFPFMGIRFEPGFQLAFAAGFLFVGFFAWKRFNEKSFDKKSFSYRVLTELDLSALRGGAAMRRAYLIYAGALLALYITMTFFGKLILETVGRLPIAGAQVDTSGLNFSSPQWPLMLAFGFAGLAPLIPPLAISETWLRRRAHQAVGIPTRIDQLARRIIDNFERRYQREETTKAVNEVVRPAWVTAHFGSAAVVGRINNVYEELRRFKEWSEEEDPDWPNRSVRADLRRLEREICADASEILQEYDDIMRQPDQNDPVAGTPPAARGQSDDAAAQARRKRLRQRIDAAVRRMTDLRGDLAAIIAVYAEGDRDFSKIEKTHHRDLRDALMDTFAFMRVRTGPEIALLVALLPLFLIYLIACAEGLHPLLKPVQITALSAVLTAGLETLRFAAIYTIPAMVAFALRFYLLDRASADRNAAGTPPRLNSTQRLSAMALGVLVSAILLCLVALLWAAVLSPTSVHFQLLLFRGGFLVYFVTQAGVSALVLYWALVACDVASPPAGFKRRWLGVLCATLVLAWLLGYFHTFYYGLNCVASGSPFRLGFFTEKICFRDNSGIDYLIYPMMAYLTCAVFGTMPKGAPARSEGGAEPSPTPHGRGAGATAHALGAAVLALIVSAAPAYSQTCPTGSEESCDVSIGFRADAEPFSFLVKTDDRAQYHGYLADLCYAIFNGSDYRLKSVSVTVSDRFGRVRGAFRPAVGEPVDVLCEPLTVRFENPEQQVRGFYSPVVFASGVTYMARKSNAVKPDAYLGVANNSTARKVARKACQVDLLRIREAGEAPEPGECDLAPPPVSAGTDFCGADGLPKLAGRERANVKVRYYFCIMADHTTLIKWFCRKENSGPNLSFHMAYFGDREIIQGKLAAYVSQEKHECPVEKIEIDPSNYTYEPYAILVSLERPELAQFVQRRVYEYFSHRANARGLFQKYFPKQQMSPALAYLFLLNGVMEQETFTIESSDEADPSWLDAATPAGDPASTQLTFGPLRAVELSWP